MSKCDPFCEAELTSHGYTPCRCDERSQQRKIVALTAALRMLIIDANRLCDRQLGGTYEEDCRRSIAVAKDAAK